MPDLNNQFNESLNQLHSPLEQEFIRSLYPKCKSISIDYAIMEKADNVFVLTADFGWSDLGTWGSIYTHLDMDENNNSITGNSVFLYNSKNCIVNIPDKKLAVLHGLDDFIVVESDNILLICKKNEEQKIKEFVNDVRIKKGDEYI
jgi:mannose-1-phosphate guanylyltransferase